MEYLYSLLGFIILLGSGNFLVKGSVSLAQYFKVSKLFIGLTIVAFGTSAPELIISLQAAIKGHPEISLGNVIGSNISNIALVLAIAAILVPIHVKRSSVVIDWPVMMIAGVLFYVFSYDGWLSRMEGIIFIILLIVYVFFSLRYSRNQQRISAEVPSKPRFSLFVSICIAVASSVGLLIGADLLINNATIIAENIGVSERVISVSIIAVGTSMPELVTSIIAAIQKESDISIGNIFGSNIFNIFSVLGITAIVKPLTVSEAIRDFDSIWMLGISFLLLLLLMPSRKSILSRLDGFLLFSIYIIYIYLVFTLNK